LRSKTLKASFGLLLFFLLNAASYAQGSVVSPPIGGSVLPGGGSIAKDFKDSTIFSKVIPFLIKYAINAAIALAVGALIIGGYQFITAYGDTEKHALAQKTITYAVIGLIVAMTAYGIVAILTSIQLS